jgi:hypothetical protein
MIVGDVDELYASMRSFEKIDYYKHSTEDLCLNCRVSRKNRRKIFDDPNRVLGWRKNGVFRVAIEIVARWFLLSI